MNVAVKPVLRPFGDPAKTFADDVVAGLLAEPKHLSPKYFYDERGSQLFEEITRLPEYYPTRTETAILEANALAIAKLIPADAAIVDFGAGSSAKARILLREAQRVAAYVPVDISAEFLSSETMKLHEDLPDLVLHPIAADFTKPFALPASISSKPRVGFFPGSTIGNFEPAVARCSSSGSISSRRPRSSMRPITTRPASPRRST
jgi:uncharacterized SAM-dependent methyltransferase